MVAGVKGSSPLVENVLEELSVRGEQSLWDGDVRGGTCVQVAPSHLEEEVKSASRVGEGVRGGGLGGFGDRFGEGSSRSLPRGVCFGALGDREAVKALESVPGINVRGAAGQVVGAGLGVR